MCPAPAGLKPLWGMEINSLSDESDHESVRQGLEELIQVSGNTQEAKEKQRKTEQDSLSFQVLKDPAQR